MIVGRAEIVGRGGYDELAEFTGAEAAPPPPPQPRGFTRGVPFAYAADSDGPHLVEEHPKHSREFPIGFTTPDNAPVPPGGSQDIEVKPQVIFRGERLAIPASIVANFRVADIKVGKDSQLAAVGEMPAECFSNLSVGVRMQLDTAEPGITITLRVRNIDQDNAHPFTSVLYGTVVE
jgi:hypothetical protein